MTKDGVLSELMLTPLICDSLVTNAQLEGMVPVSVFTNNGLAVDGTIRSCKVGEITNYEVLHCIYDYFKRMNVLGLHINDIQPVQIFCYQEGDHYLQHTDWSPTNNRTRKLSMTVQLSDPSDYEGGDVELIYGPESVVIPKEKGLATVFPSWMLHRVNPITSGTRWCLVAWATGAPLM